MVTHHSKTILLIFVYIISLQLNSQNIRQITNKDGLSNSAILSLYQDEEGLLWIGSCDGLNLFDGQKVHRNASSSNNTNNLSGNLIQKLLEAQDGTFWIHTNYGLNKLNKSNKSVVHYEKIAGRHLLMKNVDNDVFVLNSDNKFYYCQNGDSILSEVSIESISYNDILNAFIDPRGMLWIFMNDGTRKNYSINKDTRGGVELKTVNGFEHSNKIIYCYNEDNSLYFIDNTFVLYEYDLLTKSMKSVFDMESTIGKMGAVSSIIKHNEDYYIGFKTNGLIKLSKKDESNTYKVESTEIKVGVFCLLKDKYQDIIWVGTDGQGVYYITFAEKYLIQETTFDKLDHQIANPIRSIFLDNNNTMWLGTKGDGILKIDNFDPKTSIEESNMIIYNQLNSDLKDNSVYAFTGSAKDILWIGNEEGLNYYSYSEKSIKKFDLTIDNKNVKYVHALLEKNDSTLWIATVGMGVLRADIIWKNNIPQLKNIRQWLVKDRQELHNHFFTLYSENDSIIWLGNRGEGVFRLDAQSENPKSVKFADINYYNNTINDIFSILKDKNNTFWIGTSSGLIRSEKDGSEQIYNEENGLPNNTIHAILNGTENTLWFSTNRGVVKLDSKKNTLNIYNQQQGLKISEFSDGASFKDTINNIMYFGGNNGFISISETNSKKQDYLPKISFRELNIFGKSYNINNYLSDDGENTKLTLDYDQNFFSITFIVTTQHPSTSSKLFIYNTFSSKHLGDFLCISLIISIFAI